MQNVGSEVQYVGCYVKVLDMHSPTAQEIVVGLTTERPGEEGAGGTARRATVASTPAVSGRFAAWLRWKPPG